MNLNEYFLTNNLISLNKFSTLSGITLSKVKTRIKSLDLKIIKEKNKILLNKENCDLILKNCKSDDLITIQKIANKLNIDYSSVISYFNYLNIKSKEVNLGTRIVHKYTEEDFEILKKFLLNHNMKNLLTKKTKLEKYGNENYNNIEKIKQSLSKTYNENKNTVLTKRKNTMIDKYGEYFNNREKAKETCIKKYNVDSVSKVEQVKLAKSNIYWGKTEEERKNIYTNGRKTFYEKVEKYKMEKDMTSIIDVSLKFNKDKSGMFCLLEKLNIPIEYVNNVALIKKQ